MNLLVWENFSKAMRANSMTVGWASELWRGNREEIEKKWSSVRALNFFNANTQKQRTWSCKIIPSIVNSQGTCFHGQMLVMDSHVAVSLRSCFAESSHHCLPSRTNFPKNIRLHIFVSSDCHVHFILSTKRVFLTHLSPPQHL